MNAYSKGLLPVLLGSILFVCWCCPAAAEFSCTGLEQWRAGHNAQLTSRFDQRYSGPVTNEGLRAELIAMARADQVVRRRLSDASDLAASVEMSALDARNSTRLRAIVLEAGFPRASDVGVDGVRSAWLIIQHAANDPQLQKLVLHQIASMVPTGEVSGEQYAMLFDRVRLQEKDAKQLFGTQLYPGGGAVPLPIEDEVNVDLRRMAVGLMPLSAYRCLVLEEHRKSRTSQTQNFPAPDRAVDD